MQQQQEMERHQQYLDRIDVANRHLASTNIADNMDEDDLKKIGMTEIIKSNAISQT